MPTDDLPERAVSADPVEGERDREFDLALARRWRAQPAPAFPTEFTARVVHRHRVRQREHQRTLLQLRTLGGVTVGVMSAATWSALGPASTVATLRALWIAAGTSHVPAALLLGVAVLLVSRRSTARTLPAAT